MNHPSEITSETLSEANLMLKDVIECWDDYAKLREGSLANSVSPALQSAP